MPFVIRPATWPDFEELMGEKGGCGGCWCMLWRLEKKQMDAQMGEQNRLAMKAVFEAGQLPGLIAFDGDQPVGWIQVAPRSDFPRLKTSRILKPIDKADVWSVACFFIHRSYRRKGVSLQLLQEACNFAQKSGARIVEGYPVEPKKSPYPAVYAWVGFADVFQKASFEEVARRSETRPIMRKFLDQFS